MIKNCKSKPNNFEKTKTDPNQNKKNNNKKNLIKNPKQSTITITGRSFLKKRLTPKKDGQMI